MGFTGDIDAVGHLADRISDLASVPSRAAGAVSFELEVFIQDEFNEGRDPYGTPWEPLADSTRERGRTDPPLTDSWAMRDSASVRPSRGAGVNMMIDHPAMPHQTGWSGPQGDGPARPILPAGDELPSEWTEAIESAVETAVHGGRR